MAITTLTATALTVNTVSADLIPTALTAIDADKTMQVLYPREGKLLLIINVTSASDEVTISAGEYLSNGIGAYTFSAPQNDVLYLLVDSSRFKDFDGLLSIEFSDGTTGYVGALLLPY